MATYMGDKLTVAGQLLLVMENAAAYVVNYDGTAPTTSDTLEVDLLGRELLFGTDDPALSIVGLGENYTAALTNGVLVITPATNFRGTDFSFWVMIKKS